MRGQQPAKHNSTMYWDSEFRRRWRRLIRWELDSIPASSPLSTSATRMPTISPGEMASIAATSPSTRPDPDFETNYVGRVDYNLGKSMKVFGAF